MNQHGTDCLQVVPLKQRLKLIFQAGVETCLPLNFTPCTFSLANFVSYPFAVISHTCEYSYRLCPVSPLKSSNLEVKKLGLGDPWHTSLVFSNWFFSPRKIFFLFWKFSIVNISSPDVKAFDVSDQCNDCFCPIFDTWEPLQVGS